MSSKKHRKHVRLLRAKGLRSEAAWLYFKNESNRIYNQDLRAINTDGTLDEVWLAARMAYQSWFGRAQQNYWFWHMGNGPRLAFAYIKRGKVRANNIEVCRV